MKMTLSTLASVSLIALGLAACTSEPAVLSKAPGTYESETKTTNSAGTTTKQKSTTDVSVDEYGNKKAVVKQKTTSDPRGLFNKSTSESKQVIEERN